MPYYETVFETGATSIGFYEDDDEAVGAATEHHKRAMAGQPGGPTGHPAERVVKILKYDTHPGELNLGQTMSAKDLKAATAAAIDKLAVGGEVSVPELAGAVRELTSPLIADKKAHESAYVMDAVAELAVKE